jgi:hypothetical protein
MNNVLTRDSSVQRSKHPRDFNENIDIPWGRDINNEKDAKTIGKYTDTK